jgi:hypothetical protein
MSKRRFIRLAVAAAGVLVCLRLGWAAFVMPLLTPHEGDGTFADISRRAVFVMPGYAISMPAFDLGESHQAEYRVSRLPDIGRDCGLYLAFHTDDNRWWQGTTSSRVGGHLRLELLDADDQTVVNVSGKLGKYIWYGRGDLCALYKLHESFFRPDSRQEYRARIWYTPDSQLAGYKGFVYLEARRGK